jgi:hypothetical protein
MIAFGQPPCFVIPNLFRDNTPIWLVMLKQVQHDELLVGGAV